MKINNENSKIVRIRRDSEVIFECDVMEILQNWCTNIERTDISKTPFLESVDEEDFAKYELTKYILIFDDIIVNGFNISNSRDLFNEVHRICRASKGTLQREALLVFGYVVQRFDAYAEVDPVTEAVKEVWLENRV